MAEEKSKRRIMLIEAMVAAILLIFIGAYMVDRVFPTPQVGTGDGNTIVGFVPIEIKSQSIDITATKPTAYLLFTERDSQFSITSLRISGNVKGQGRAEVVLDNGIGQELVIYSNIKKSQGNMITGMAVSEDENALPADTKIDKTTQPWLLIKEENDITETPKTEIGEAARTTEGLFQYICKDTCYMNMKMQKELVYTLKIRLDAGTEISITELSYMLEV
jgi:hypothetical protein